MVANSESASPSAAKPEQVVASWMKQFPIEIVEPNPVTTEDLGRAHNPQFVSDILECKKKNGFDNKSPTVAASLLWTSGSMLSAARHAVKSGKVAVAPCAGFHHAERSKAMGFCTFNGLMVTALALREDGVKKIGILDLDMHYGNGTDNILERVNGDKWCTHFTAGLRFQTPDKAPKFFDDWLPFALDRLKDCNIVLFQAGADPHISDPYGGWLTTPELMKRDEMVFDALAKSGVPVAWNLAGGYQVEPDGSIPKVLEIHDNTMRECVRIYGDVP